MLPCFADLSLYRLPKRYPSMYIVHFRHYFKLAQFLHKHFRLHLYKVYTEKGSLIRYTCSKHEAEMFRILCCMHKIISRKHNHHHHRSLYSHFSVLCNCCDCLKILLLQGMLCLVIVLHVASQMHFVHNYSDVNEKFYNYIIVDVSSSYSHVVYLVSR